MRTSIDIGDQILREAKKMAAREDTSLKQIVEDALRSYLRGPRRRTSDYRLVWHTENGRLQPGVRLDDRDVLFDIMEARR